KLEERLDHRHSAARLARINGQWQTPEPLARNTPVGHVRQPVVHASAGVGGRPFDVGVGGAHPRSDLIGFQKPLVDDPKNQFMLASPAMRIAMAVRVLAEEAAGGLQMMKDVWRRIQKRPTSVVTEASDVSTGLVYGRNHPQPVEPSEFEVLLAASRRDVDDTSTFVGRNVLPGHDRVLDA